MSLPTFSGFKTTFANTRPAPGTPGTGPAGVPAGRSGDPRIDAILQSDPSRGQYQSPDSPSAMDVNPFVKAARSASNQYQARALLNQQLTDPGYVAQMGQYGTGLRSLDLQLQRNNAMSGLDASSLRRNAGLQRQGLGLDREALGIEEGGINFQLGNIPALRGLLERGRTNDIGGIDQSARMEKIRAESEATGQGGWFRPMLGIERDDIRQRAERSREGVQIGYERDTIGLNERERSLQDRLAGVGVDYRRLGLSEQQINSGLNDALAKLGLDKYFSAADLLAQKAGLSTQQTAYQQSVLQQLIDMLGWGG